MPRKIVLINLFISHYCNLSVVSKTANNKFYVYFFLTKIELLKLIYTKDLIYVFVIY